MITIRYCLDAAGAAAISHGLSFCAAYAAIATCTEGDGVSVDGEAGRHADVGGHVRVGTGGGRYAVAPGNEVVAGVGDGRYKRAATAGAHDLRRGAADGAVGAGSVCQGVAVGGIDDIGVVAFQPGRVICSDSKVV